MGRTSQKSWVRVAAAVRRQGRAVDAPCALCGGALGPIDWRDQGEADREAKAAGEWWRIGVHRPLALSVDHVVPYAAGGEDSLDNAAATHRTCNEKAGAKAHRRHATKPRPVVGHWQPIGGNGEPLPGRAVPGQRTGTHVFFADPPSPVPIGTFGIAHPSSSPEHQGDPQ